LSQFKPARFYSAVGSYYRSHENDIPKALEYFNLAISLAEEIKDPQRKCLALNYTSQCHWQLGDYVEGQRAAQEMRALAKANGYFYSESQAIQSELLCRTSLGDFTHSFELSADGRKLLSFCGLRGSTNYLNLLDSDADVHFQKTEYTESRLLYADTCPKHAPLNQAYDRLAIVRIDIEIGADEHDILRDLQEVKAAFISIQNPPGITLCDVANAYLDLREGRVAQAKSDLQRCFTSTRGNDQEISLLCLEKLADLTRGMFDIDSTLGWALVLLGFAQKGKNKISIHKALRRLGDIFHANHDEITALTLFQVALDGFVSMDIHRSKAACMMRIGDIVYKQGQIAEAEAMWKTARLLFERSLQKKDIERIDDRLT
jgi:tetratricopeptide (TPR) repeat protein